MNCHLRRDLALARVVQLRDGLAGLRVRAARRDPRLAQLRQALLADRGPADRWCRRGGPALRRRQATSRNGTRNDAALGVSTKLRRTPWLNSETPRQTCWPSALVWTSTSPLSLRRSEPDQVPGCFSTRRSRGMRGGRRIPLAVSFDDTPCRRPCQLIPHSTRIRAALDRHRAAGADRRAGRRQDHARAAGAGRSRTRAAAAAAAGGGARDGASGSPTNAAGPSAARSAGTSVSIGNSRATRGCSSSPKASSPPTCSMIRC